MKKKSNITVLSVQELLERRKEIRIGRVVKDSEIDYSDIPKFSKEQLAQFKRTGRPVIGESRRKAISIRIEETTLKKLKAKAKKEGVAYQSLINDILKKAI